MGDVLDFVVVEGDFVFGIVSFVFGNFVDVDVDEDLVVFIGFVSVLGYEGIYRWIGSLGGFEFIFDNMRIVLDGIEFIIWFGNLIVIFDSWVVFVVQYFDLGMIWQVLFFWDEGVFIWFLDF